MRLTPLLCAALGAAAGFYIFPFTAFLWLFVFAFFLTLVHCFFRVVSSLDSLFQLIKPRTLRLAALCSAALALGFVFGISAANAGLNTVHFSLPQEKITGVEGVLLEDPRIIGQGRAMAVLSLQRAAAEGGTRASARGEVTVFFLQEQAARLREFGRGATVFCEGYLRHSGTGWTFSANSLHIVKSPPPIERMRTRMRLNLVNSFTSLSDSTGVLDTGDKSGAGGLSLALLLGIRDELDSNLALAYRDAGLSHILALSGMHLSVLAAIIAFLLKKPLGLKAAAIAGAVLVCLYVFLVGPLPSLDRSAIMYLLGTLAIVGMLPKEPLSLLALSFLIQLFVTPAAGNSISFILSYLALGGIFIIARPVYLLFAGFIPDILLQPLSVSFGAFLATAGVTTFVFGTAAPIGIIAGLFLIPLTTVYMIASLLWLLLDLISLSAILSPFLILLYRLKELIVTAASQVPAITGVNSVLIIVISILLSVIIVIFERRRQREMLYLRPFT